MIRIRTYVITDHAFLILYFCHFPKMKLENAVSSLEAVSLTQFLTDTAPCKLILTNKLCTIVSHNQTDVLQLYRTMKKVMCGNRVAKFLYWEVAWLWTEIKISFPGSEKRRWNPREWGRSPFSTWFFHSCSWACQVVFSAHGSLKIMSSLLFASLHSILSVYRYWAVLCDSCMKLQSLWGGRMFGVMIDILYT